MRLNSIRCVFGLEVDKFLGFMLTNRKIEANPNKCQAVMDMQSPQSVKEVQQLAGRIATRSRFITSLAHKAIPLHQF